MRHKNWIARVGTLEAALEVRSLGGALVPVVTVRGLPVAAEVAFGSIGGGASVSLRLDGGAPAETTCHADTGAAGSAAYECAPAVAAAPALAAGFPTAKSLTVRMAVTAPGFTTLPQTERSLDLSGTAAALMRLRQAGVSSEALPAEPGLDWRGLLGKLLKATGYGTGPGLSPAAPSTTRHQ